MAIGNPISLTSNVATKAINVIATASQTSFTVTGGYRLNELSVFRNGVRLVNGRDFTARDGLTVTLLSAATEGDVLEFQVFDTFRVADAITPFDSAQTIAGDLSIVGVLSATQLGSVNFNLTSGIQTFHDVRVGGALTVAGTLTYEDTTNTTNTGLSTFSGGMNISGVGATITTLSVTGVSTFGDKVSIGDSIFHTGDTNTAIRFPAADTFTVETGGSEKLRVTSGVVITGIATATEFLQVLGAAGASGKGIEARSTSTQATDTNKAIRVRNNSDTDTFSLSYRGAATFGGDLTIPDKIIHSGDTNTAIRFPSADAFTVETGGTERLRVDSDGIKVVGATQITATQPQINFTAGGSAVAQAGQILVGENGGGGDLLLKTKTTGGTLTTRLTVGNDGTVNLPDNGKFTCGAGDDLQIYADGTDSYIDNDEGDLLIRNTGDDIIIRAADDVLIQTQGSEGAVIARGNGTVELYHDNALRLATTADGADFSGTGSIKVPVGTTAQRSGSPTAGDFRYNSTTGAFEGYTSEWGSIGGSSGITTAAQTVTDDEVHLALSSAQDHKVTATGICTIFPGGGTEAESHTVRIINSGIATVGFSTQFLFPSGSAPSLPTADGAISLISFTINKVGVVGIATELLAGASVNFS